MNKVIYYSKGGNTEKLAKAVAKGAGVVAQSINETSKLENVDTLFVGGSIYAGKIDGILRDFLQGISKDQVKKVAVFSSSANKKTALMEIKSILEPKGIKVLNDEFFCKGSFLFLNNGRPNFEDLEEAELFGKKHTKTK